MDADSPLIATLRFLLPLPQPYGLYAAQEMDQSLDRRRCK